MLLKLETGQYWTGDGWGELCDAEQDCNRRTKIAAMKAAPDMTIEELPGTRKNEYDRVRIRAVRQANKKNGLSRYEYILSPDEKKWLDYSLNEYRSKK